MLIEGVIGWLKNVALLRKSRFVGRWKLKHSAYLAGAMYNILRLVKLEEAAQ
jgi:hypothetical protein